MGEEFKECLNEFLNNKTYIVAYRSNYDSAREFNKDLILYIKNLQEENQSLKEQLKQKEDIIKKAKNWIDNHDIDDSWELLEVLDNKGSDE